MDCTPITECIACGSNALMPVLDLGYQPLANSYAKSPRDIEQDFPLAINRCTSCYHVQLTHKVNPELMFKDYAYVSGTAKTQLDYFDWLVEHITRTYGSTPKTVLDIGCNDGSFLNAWGGTGAKTYGVDPAENLYPLSSKNHTVECGFFTGKEFLGTNFDVITCMNAFAHNADQLNLLVKIRDRLHENGLVFCTTSQADMIINGEFDTIYHEHLSFYNVKSAEAIVRRAGMNLIDVYKHPIHGTSYIFVMSKTRNETQVIKNLIDIEASRGLYDSKTYRDYAEKCYKVAHDFANTIREFRKEGYTIVGYGAPAKGNTLMNFAEEKPDYTFEDNPLKQGLYTPGVKCEIRKPSYDFGPNDKVLWVPLAWNFYDEIVGKIKTNTNAGTNKYLKYFPTFEVQNG